MSRLGQILHVLRVPALEGALCWCRSHSCFGQGSYFKNDWDRVSNLCRTTLTVTEPIDSSQRFLSLIPHAPVGPADNFRLGNPSDLYGVRVLMLPRPVAMAQEPHNASRSPRRRHKQLMNLYVWANKISSRRTQQVVETTWATSMQVNWTIIT